MKSDEALDPIYVELFCARAVAVEAHGRPDLVEQFWGFGTWQSWVLHLAAFLADVPSMRQEIDCNLQSNSR
jgi:hypothetical protein